MRRGLAAGWAPCGRDGRFAAHGSRFFCGAIGTPRPCKRFAVFAAAGVCLVDCTPANGTPFSLYNGVWVCCRYAIRFFVPPAPPLIPGSPCRFLFAPAPEVHLRATKIADLSQAQNPAAFAETDELFDVSDRTKVYLKSRKFSLFLQTQRDFAKYPLFSLFSDTP